MGYMSKMMDYVKIGAAALALNASSALATPSYQPAQNYDAQKAGIESMVGAKVDGPLYKLDTIEKAVGGALGDAPDIGLNCNRPRSGNCDTTTFCKN